ncbi:MAG: protein-methionine-sulfoxide reductase catalytic subunit MsrP [Alphaproteobacteria bacterium]|nr:protein-methionine-sulfoxide reductase catalytic subunit MsrP [Alphaproteobacteria bacterium]
MLLRRRRGWELSDRAATDPAIVLGRRAALLGSATLAVAAPRLSFAEASAPVPRNPKYDGGRPLTAEKDATTYNNYYEFSDDKDLWESAQGFPQRPWQIHIEGLVKQPRTLDLDDLLKRVALEERVYRHRCVEAWAMTVPWTGFPLARLVALAEPLDSAKFVVFETASDPKYMRGIRRSFYPFPYTEALTIEEAGNELAFLSTGLYGKPMPPQNGGPIRLTVPWKYGFKSAKALIKVSFAEKRPTTFWEAIQPSEYGFWANVNPAVPHPRWSQASERLLTTGERVPTQIYNGYGAFVASLYEGKQGEKLFM